MHRLIAILFLLPMLACKDPFAPEDAERFLPKSNSWFADQLEELAMCMEIHVSPETIERIEWYTVPGKIFWTKTHGWAAAANQYNRIFIASWWIWNTAGWITRHELAHFLTGYNDHPDYPFRTCKLMNDQQSSVFENVVVD